MARVTARAISSSPGWPVQPANRHGLPPPSPLLARWDTFVGMAEGDGAGQPGGKISSFSCGGQPTAVSVVGETPTYLYQSDVWHEGEANQTNATQYWGPLEFYDDGRIRPLDCHGSFDAP